MILSIKDKDSHCASSSLLLLVSLSVFLSSRSTCFRWNTPVFSIHLVRQFNGLNFHLGKVVIFLFKRKKDAHIFKIIFASRHDEDVDAWIPHEIVLCLIAIASFYLWSRHHLITWLEIIYFITFSIKFLGTRDRERTLETKSEPPVGVARTGVGEGLREDKSHSIR